MVGAALSMLGCASSGGAPQAAVPTRTESQPAAPESPDAPQSDERGSWQGLFRLRYSGIDGRGRVRLALRSSAGDRFQLTASDTFGRRLWSFESNDGKSLLLDHRAAEYCHLGGEIVVRAVALSELPVSTLPRVLSGDLPLAPPADVELPLDGEIEFRARDGRQWSARYRDGTLATWTLWRDGSPLVWWQRSGEGGVLSHLDGAQVLWKTVTLERSTEDLPPLEVPAGYAAGTCDGDDLS